MKPTKKQAQGLILAWMTSTPAGQKAARVLGFITLIGILTFVIALSCASTATGQEYDYEKCASIGRSSGEFKEFMWCLDRLDAKDKGKKYWRTPTPNDPTYRRMTEEVAAQGVEREAMDKAERIRQLASQVSSYREKYESARHHFTELVNNGGAGHWDNEVRFWTSQAGGLMVENYEKWEKAVNEERNFRESVGMGNPQYDRNIRNLEKAKQDYTEIWDKARVRKPLKSAACSM